MHHRTRPLGPVALLACAGLFAACDTPQEASAPISVSVSALSGTACGDPDAPTPGVDPFADIANLTIAVRGVDAATGVFGTLARESTPLRGATSLRLREVPEGTGREVIVHGRGAAFDWYARDSDVTIQRNTDNPVSLLFTRYGGLSCVPAPATIPNVTFPASVELGDGRIMISGGFTAVETTGETTYLTEPSNQAFIFDPRTGDLVALGSMGSGAARAGHAMAYIPQADQVLIVGGFTRLRLDETRDFPFAFDPGDKADARADYVIFDVATGVFSPGVEEMALARGFPRAHTLGDGTVVITGGGPWPFDTSEPGYLNVEIYDHEKAGRAGGFLDARNFRSFYPRSGHSLTFLKNSAEGLSQLLVWGGTTPDRSVGHPAEVFRQSGRQREGVNGTFVEVTIVGEPPSYTYFHEATRLAGQRFLVTGGAAYEGGAIRAPRADEAWLLTYVEDPSPIIQAQRIPGLGAGRVFHTAASSDLVNVSVIGGFTGLEALTTDKVVFFNLADSVTPWTRDSVANDLFVPRGGHAGVLTHGGPVVLVGGEENARPRAAGQRVNVEVFTPSHLPEP